MPKYKTLESPEASDYAEDEPRAIAKDDVESDMQEESENGDDTRQHTRQRATASYSARRAANKSIEQSGTSSKARSNSAHSKNMSYESPSSEADDDAYEDGTAADNDDFKMMTPTDVPFEIVYKNAKTISKRNKKRKLDFWDDNSAEIPDLAYGQDYTIKPEYEWEHLSSFKNFVVGDEKFSIGDYVFVNHDNVLTAAVITDPSLYWIGRVLEIRAIDKSNVYIRLFWMYWPSELPGGRKYYHGNKELVASQHMDLIDAMTVSAKATVVHWIEDNNEYNTKMSDLFWRQRYDSSSQELMPLRKHCRCKKYYNPDKVMVWCTSCHNWLHEECVIEDIRKRYADDIKKVESSEPVLSPGKARKKIAGNIVSNLGPGSRKGKSGDAVDDVEVLMDNKEMVAQAAYTSVTGPKRVPIICLICQDIVS
ncbi:uncharacterized protein V1518DRAFT_20146 [Limtongia smithiae]|uniref:uncharacterized protein n=1 Tax=Limtongia smithiae TaxID=1125753 RepID=UPI0034CFF89A